MDALVRDLRFAVRGLSRTPGFTLAAVLALALGIGATTAIFSVVHAVLLRSLGWGDESRLVSLRTDWAGHKIEGFALSVPEVVDLRSAPFLESSGAYLRDTAALQGERAERVPVGYATSGFFTTLGVRAAFGRTFEASEDLKGSDGVALLSWAGWRRRFAGDPAAVGRSVTLDGRPYRIVGVLPEGFVFRDARDFYLPFGFTEEQLLHQRGAHYLEGVGRLRGTDLPAARRLLDEFSARVREANPDQYPADAGFRFSMIPLRDRAVGSSRQPLLLLMGAVLLVLLIACGNVANLLLARSASRERELAVRSALGAGRGRLVRQLLTESALLAAAGTALGVMLSLWALEALLAAAPRAIRDLADVRVEPAVLAFCAGLAVTTTLIFGLIPALRASLPDLTASLKDGGQSTAAASAGRLRGALVAGQVALSLLLLVGAGLVLRSFAGVLQIAPGFDPQGVQVARLFPAGAAYDADDARMRYFEQALRAAAVLPGVSAAGAIDRLPMEGNYQLSYFIDGYQQAPGEPQPSDQIRRAGPGYFHAMRQPLLAGREFADSDDARAPLVALVNEAWVRRYAPGREVIGHRIRLDSKKNGDWRTIVGVVADAREKGLEEPAPPVYYFAAAQLPPDQLTLVVRGGQPGELREALARIDPTQPVDPPAALEEVIASSLQARKFPLQLLGVFAALALVLAALGIYGVTSYAVAQRTREIGVRMAIGATAGSVVRLVLAGALRTVAVGLAAGALAALAFSRVLASQLYGVSPRDPLTYLSLCALLAAVALLASVLPALRAARVDPISALRAE